VRLRGFSNFVPDLFFASNIKTLLQLTTDLDGARLELDYSPSTPIEYRNQIGVSVAFKSGRNRLTISSAAMNDPLPGKFSSDSQAHWQLAENLLASIALGRGLQERVTEILGLARDKTLRHDHDRRARRGIRQSRHDQSRKVGSAVVAASVHEDRRCAGHATARGPNVRPVAKPCDIR